MTLICPQCGNKNEDPVRFCTSCGNPLVPTVVQPRAPTSPPMGQVLTAAPPGRHNTFLIIAISVVAVVMILAALYFLQASGTLSIFPSAAPAVTQQTSAPPEPTSYVLVENPTSDRTEIPTETPAETVHVTESPHSSPTVTKVLICPSDRQICGGNCTDIMTDRRNCGGCSVSCTPTETCQQGHCRVRCTDSETSCPDGCHNLLFDAENCGFCGNACPKGLTCNNSQCAPPLKTAIPTYIG